MGVARRVSSGGAMSAKTQDGRLNNSPITAVSGGFCAFRVVLAPVEV